MATVVEIANEIAQKAHAGQFRRDGKTPYINHPLAVAERMGDDQDARALALVHDVLEDSKINEQNMLDAGLPPHIVTAAMIMTHIDGERYSDYLRRVAKNALAKKVKIQDMLHNLSDQPTERQILKYARGLITLLDERR